MKRQLLKHMWVLLVAALFLQCGGEDETPEPEGSGSFTYKGTTYSGICKSVKSGANAANINVLIDGTTGSIIIYNMPQAASGTFTFNDGYTNINSADKLYAFLSGPNTYGTAGGGTLTKTGSKTFTFTCQVYYLLEPATLFTITGEGTY